MTISDNPKTVKNSFTVLKVAYIIQVSFLTGSALSDASVLASSAHSPFYDRWLD